MTAGYSELILSLVRDSCMAYDKVDTLTWDKMHKNLPGKGHNNSPVRKCLKISKEA